MTKHRRILNVIGQIRAAHPVMKDIFTKGGCLNLFCVLRAVYPEARAWFNVDHVITEIDGKYYDITGTVSSKGYLRFVDYGGGSRRNAKMFNRMRRAKALIVSDDKAIAFLKGIADCRSHNGDRFTGVNPYPIGSDNWHRWHAGWEDEFVTGLKRNKYQR